MQDPGFTLYTDANFLETNVNDQIAIMNEQINSDLSFSSNYGGYSTPTGIASATEIYSANEYESLSEYDNAEMESNIEQTGNLTMLELNNCFEIQKRLILAIQIRSEAYVLMGTNYEVYNKDVLVPVTRLDYQQLMGMFQAPYRSVDERLGVYLVKKCTLSFVHF
tara:strand:+ start:815 stop:1309 length:495 start_codon:yes stop_codon:yes gene_type:complete